MRHEEVHLQRNQFQCEYCGRSYRYSRSLNVHYRRCHQNSTLNKNSYKCETCGQEFPFELHLKRHAQVHSAEAQTKCNKCGRLYLCKKSLYVHRNLCKERSTDGKAPCAHPEFVCEICGNTFRTKVVLRRHQQIHSAGKGFDCNICGKRYTQKASLWRHNVQTHTVESREILNPDEQTFAETINSE
ncbi:zinc finger protein 90 [Clonorchis sinensis]|uniref:Zinc finger protein 90 n=1 Tax=Clonorchis sinensis TaxID=79923 RepID=G7Y6S2_CLOSI|nr:zinc finger protein 90 [Clonorchis sinensis]